MMVRPYKGGEGGTESGHGLKPHPPSPAKEKSRSPVPEPVFISEMEPKGGCG